MIRSKIRLKITTKNTGILQMASYLSIVYMLVLWGGIYMWCACVHA